MSTKQKIAAALSQINECLYDHGAGKYAGPVSAEQRNRAFDSARFLAVELRRLAAVEAAQDALRARLDGAVKAAQEVFGEKAIRYKFSLDEDGRPYATLPPEMDGRWYALQPAEDDAHIGLCDEIVRLRAELAAAKAQVEALSMPDSQLCSFYEVSSFSELVAAQERHIEQLQSKLPNIQFPYTTQVRIG